MLTEDQIKQILNSHRQEIEDLKAKSATLDNSQAELLKKQLELLQEQNRNLQEKYDLLLKHILEKERPKESVSQVIDVLHVDKLQLLLFLNGCRAVDPASAMTSTDIKVKFNIRASEKTIRNKLNEAELARLVISHGLKPKYYYLTEQGIQLLKREQKEALQIIPY